MEQSSSADLADNIVNLLTWSDIDRSSFDPARSIDAPNDAVRVTLINPRATKSDVELITQIAHILRLMHAELIGIDAGSSFVEKFSRKWLGLVERTEWPSRQLEAVVDELDEFYESIQLFDERALDSEHQPYQLGPTELQALTKSAYERLLDVWRSYVATAS